MQLDSEIFQRLAKIRWFSKCGQKPEGNFGFDNLEIAANWEVAKGYLTSLNWENATLEARNKITEKLSSKYQNEFQYWNKLTNEARDRLTKEIMPQIIAFQEHNVLPDRFNKCVRWDILAAVMETTYKRCLSPGFFSKLLAIYEDGHFPCGWRGEWPQGNVILI